MAYFNGGTGGYHWLGRYVPLVRTTLVYCDTCGPKLIPGYRHEVEFGRHFDTGFKWAPRYGGNTKCNGCGKEC